MAGQQIPDDTVFAQGVVGCSLMQIVNVVGVLHAPVTNVAETRFILKNVRVIDLRGHELRGQTFARRLRYSDTVCRIPLGHVLPDGIVLGNNRFWDCKKAKNWSFGAVQIGNSYYLSSGWPDYLRDYNLSEDGIVRFFEGRRPDRSRFNVIQCESHAIGNDRP